MSIKSKINIFFAVLLPITIALFLQFLPLTNTTGYEFSLILTIPLFLSGGLLKLSSLNFRTARSLTIITLSVPLIISLFSNLFFSECPISTDVLFYLVLSVPAFICGYFIGFIIYERLRRFQIITFILTLIFLLLISLLEFYFRPQIYFYNIVYGFFPGTMYDENISITFQLVFYRILTLLFLFISVWLFSNRKNKKQYLQVILFIIIFFSWFVFFKPMLGFSTSVGAIKSELSQELVTDHFMIYIDPDINYDSTSIKNIHEFYYDRVVKELNLNEEMTITSFIFKDRAQKKKLFGSENADVAKPWLKQIYIDESGFERTLKHELVHILAAEFGNFPFDVAHNLNPALIEGLAVAVENNYDDSDIDYITALAIENGYELNVTELFDGFNFMGNLSSLSYLFSGSFTKYLLDKYGNEKLKTLYGSGDFEEVYGKDISQLAMEFNQFISNKKYVFSSASAQLNFGRQPLIKKICPRLAARVEREGWDLYREKEFNQALEKFTFVYNSVGTYSSLNGIILTNVQQKDYKTAQNLAIEKLTSFSNTSYFYHLILRIADLSILNLDSLSARQRINQLQNLNPSIGYYNSTVIRELLLKHGLELYENYLLAENAEKIVILFELAQSSGNYSSMIPTLIELISSTKQNDIEILNYVKDLTFDSSREGVYAAYELSKYYFSKNKLEFALHFSKMALENNKRIEFQPILEEQTKLIGWSIEQK